MIPNSPQSDAPTLPRVVIDTNVCLDLFVFRDPRWAALLAAITERRIEAVTRDDCRTEWSLVLHYPHLPLDDESRVRSAAEFDAAIACLPTVTPCAEQIRLPVCKDPDDQKFLELARDAQASVLITKDKALLKLARKTAAAGMFSIMLPETWLRAQTEPG